MWCPVMLFNPYKCYITDFFGGGGGINIIDANDERFLHFLSLGCTFRQNNCDTVSNSSINLCFVVSFHWWRVSLSACSRCLSCPSIPDESLSPELGPCWPQQSDLLSQWSSACERSPAGFGSDNSPRPAEPVWSQWHKYLLTVGVRQITTYLVGVGIYIVYELFSHLYVL